MINLIASILKITFTKEIKQEILNDIKYVEEFVIFRMNEIQFTIKYNNKSYKLSYSRNFSRILVNLVRCNVKVTQ
ncbi:hypothetical protein CISIN_1g035071mg [Citrus sinensis]|uniref:Uncharacterized protein n=1 Tax=Citrus sinensis TaxID=2711 RepID=A0A067EDS8_CITSI|nr:hypothetical protein CISIN_1g035071mg [Citrus sinensis]